MEAQLEEIRDQQKQSWNKLSGGWKKWDELIMDFLKPMGDQIIEDIHPSGNDLILDIAAGTGEPGLTIATMLTTGKVFITDVAGDMLVIAKENAEERGINNIETVVCDVCELPFPDNSFDAISCRFGLMFFPDMLLAINEMARVLKPGGRIASSYWNDPDKDYWVVAIMEIINRNIDNPAPLHSSPGIYRCAEPGFIKSLFEKAGFKNIKEIKIASSLKAGTAETYWNFLTEVGASTVAALSKTDDTTRKKIKDEVLELLSSKFEPGKVAIPGSATVISAEK